MARRPGVDHDQAHVLDASLLHRLAKDRRLADRFLAIGELLHHDRRLHAFGQCFVASDGACAEVDVGLVAPAGRLVEQDHERLAREFAPPAGARRTTPSTAPSARRSRTGRCRRAALFLPDARHRERDLGRLERIERVPEPGQFIPAVPRPFAAARWAGLDRPNPTAEPGGFRSRPKDQKEGHQGKCGDQRGFKFKCRRQVLVMRRLPSGGQPE